MQYTEQEEKDNEYVRCERCKDEGYSRTNEQGKFIGYWCDDCFEYNFPTIKDSENDN